MHTWHFTYTCESCLFLALMMLKLYLTNITLSDHLTILWCSMHDKIFIFFSASSSVLDAHYIHSFSHWIYALITSICLMQLLQFYRLENTIYRSIAFLQILENLWEEATPTVCHVLWKLPSTVNCFESSMTIRSCKTKRRRRETCHMCGLSQIYSSSSISQTLKANKFSQQRFFVHNWGVKWRTREQRS